jgi:hypothetical protein
MFSCNSRKKRIESLEIRIVELKAKQFDFLKTSYLSNKKEIRNAADYSKDSISQIIAELEKEINGLKEQGGVKISIDY